ncbi:hypothetical protein FLAG1_06967 [Fusarium langsethiae]|uniref:Uncharacterized protein n=1 Tax=Fusarium langsethiae TaxID=179993 RepID=A0A0M9EUY0_FUSLA|nr:hypothetical protein FLAG1_06967 [Fusarium langsethiae]
MKYWSHDPSEESLIHVSSNHDSRINTKHRKYCSSGISHGIVRIVTLFRFVSFQECQRAPDRVPVCWKCTKAIPLKRRQRLTIYHAISAVHAEANIHE